MRGPLALLDDAWSLTLRNLKLLVLIYLPPTVAAAVLGYVSLVLFPEDASGAIYLPYDSMFSYLVGGTVFVLAFVVSLVGSLGLLKSVMKPQGATFASAYRYGLRYFLPFLLLSFLVGLATLLGLMLFVIPGIIVSVWFIFSQFLFVEEDLRATKAMRASYELTRGKWWRIFGRLVALVALFLVIYIALGIVMGLLAATLGLGSGLVELIVTNLASLVLTPLAIAYLYELYRDTKDADAD